jgi:hypothetical protein
MKSNEPVFLPTQREVDRQALTCIAIVSVASCALTIVFGLLVWSLAPQIYPLIAGQVAGLSETTATVLYVSSEGTSRTCDSWENACGRNCIAAATGDGLGGWYLQASHGYALPGCLRSGRGGAATALPGRSRCDQRIDQITVLSGDRVETTTVPMGS